MADRAGGFLSKSSYIRSLKNLTVASTAIITRAAIDGVMRLPIP